jgi:hypothetical protein
MNPVGRPVRLADSRVDPPVPIAAEVIRHFPSTRLPAVEALWSPARLELATAREVGGAPLESGHWKWTAKGERVDRGELSLVAVECVGDVQGLMAIPTRPRAATLSPGESVLYVDYLEAAPWNQRAPGHPPRFIGAGSVLIADAIRASDELGYGGRVGLHALPQAVTFYQHNCAMTRVGPDPEYYDLIYFEYADRAGLDWLAWRMPDGQP